MSLSRRSSPPGVVQRSLSTTSTTSESASSERWRRSAAWGILRSSIMPGGTPLRSRSAAPDEASLRPRCAREGGRNARRDLLRLDERCARAVVEHQERREVAWQLLGLRLHARPDDDRGSRIDGSCASIGRCLTAGNPGCPGATPPFRHADAQEPDRCARRHRRPRSSRRHPGAVPGGSYPGRRLGERRGGYEARPRSGPEGSTGRRRSARPIRAFRGRRPGGGRQRPAREGGSRAAALRTSST